MPGPGKKPAGLKVVADTSRKDREPEAAIEMPSLDTIQEPPDWLPNSHAIKEWNRLAQLVQTLESWLSSPGRLLCRPSAAN